MVYKNAVRNHLEDHDFVIIYDPQPLPMIVHYERRGAWIWRCHIDLSQVNKELWSYLRPFIKRYDAVILSNDPYSHITELRKKYHFMKLREASKLRVTIYF